MLASNCSSYLLVTFQPKEIYLLAALIALLTAGFCAGFYTILQKLHLSRDQVYYHNTNFQNSRKYPISAVISPLKQDHTFPDNNKIDINFNRNKTNLNEKETYSKKSGLKKNQKLKPNRTAKNQTPDGSKIFSISKILGETQIIDEFPDYLSKVKSDFSDIFQILTRKDLKILMFVVTLENLTPEISCIFFYYFIEILKFSYFDVNSVFVFASIGFLCSLVILNLEFIGTSFENFYKVTSFLLAIAYYLNLR